MPEEITINGETVVAKSAEEKALVREFKPQDLEIVDNKITLKPEEQRQ